MVEQVGNLLFRLGVVFLFGQLQEQFCLFPGRMATVPIVNQSLEQPLLLLNRAGLLLVVPETRDRGQGIQLGDAFFLGI